MQLGNIFFNAFHLVLVFKIYEMFFCLFIFLRIAGIKLLFAIVHIRCIIISYVNNCLVLLPSNCSCLDTI